MTDVTETQTTEPEMAASQGGPVTLVAAADELETGKHRDRQKTGESKNKDKKRGRGKDGKKGKKKDKKKSTAKRTGLNIVLLGPPGAGKGTQAERLERELRLAHVASGDLFRENLRSQTELGLLAKTYMDKGELVPDDVTMSMVRDRLQQPDCERGAILDGFPRTLAQAQGLDDLLAALGRSLRGVLFVSVPDEELVRRLSGRWVCRQCQAPYHTEFSPPTQDGVCDACDGELYQRDDDRPETVRTRLTVYHHQTAPLIDYYRQQGLLVEIDGSGDIDEVSRALLKAACDLNGGSLDPCCGQCSCQGKGEQEANRAKHNEPIRTAARPTIDAAAFGSITIDGETFRHDVILRLDGSIDKRKKKLSKRTYGTSHILSVDEARYVYEKGADVLIVGTGRFDSVRLSDDAALYLKESSCEVRLAPTSEAIDLWNAASGQIIGLFHVTC